MVEVGQVSFKAVIDASNIRSEVAKVNNILARETLRLRVQLDTTAVDRELARVRNAIAQTAKVPLAATTAIAPAAPQGRFARDFDAALGRQQREAASLSREFDKTAAAAERAAQATARIQIRQQEREAAALARELQRAERAAAQAQSQTQRLSFAKQQREVEQFAREFEKAAAAQQRLQQQQSRDRQTLAGASFSPREVQGIEAALKRVNAETQRADQVAALLRQKYGLADAEAQKLAGSLTQVGRENNALAGTLDQFGNNLLAKFFSIQAAIGAVQSAIGLLTGTLAQAASDFNEFETGFLGFQAKTQELDASGLEQFDQLFKDVASTTSFTPAQIADTAAQLRALGVEVDGVQQNLLSIAQVSDVLKEDPVLTGKVVQGSLAAYGRFGETAESILELFTQSINTTAAGATSGLREFEQLNSKASGLAANLGVSARELVAIFALFRETGATAQVSASTIETLLTKIASKRSEFEKEGISLEFKDDGGLDFAETLINIGKRIEDLSEPGQVSFLTPILGESAASDVFKAIATFEEGFARVDAAIGETSGAIERTFDIVSSGTEFQAGVLGGVLTAAFTELGKAVNPVQKALIELQKQVIGASEVDLTPLTEAAQRFATVIGDNPQLVQALADAVSSFANTAIRELGAVLDAVTSLSLSDDLPEAIAEIGRGLETLFVALSRFAQGVVGFGELAAGLFVQREIFPGVETSIIKLLSPLEQLRVLFQLVSGVLREITDRVNGFVDEYPRLTDVVLGSIPGLREAIAALRFLRGQLESPTEFAGASVATSGLNGALEGLKSFSGAVDDIREEVNEGDPIGPTFKTPEEGLAAKDALKRFRDDLANELAGIEQTSANAEIGLLEAGADPSAFLANEQTALDARIKAREQFIADTAALLEKTEKTVAEELQLGRALADAERDLARDRLQSIRLVQRGRQEAIDELKRSNDRAIAELDRSAAGAALAIAETPLTNRDRAAAEARAEQESLQQRIANRQQFLDQLKAQEAQGGLSAEQARNLGNQIIAVETEVLNQRVQLARNLEAERKRIADEGFADQLASLQQFQQQQEFVLGQQTQALNEQQRLLQADTSLATARNQLDQARLNTALAIANAERNTAGAVALQGELAQAQLSAIQTEFKSKREGLAISQQLARIEAQRNIQLAEIAALEADIAARRAQASGATALEVAGLRQIADIRAAQVDSARQAAAVTDQILEKQREELGIQERISAEQLRQNAINERANRLFEARRGIISALAAENNTSKEDSLANVQRIQERLRTAQRAGLFQGEDVRGATREVQRALRSGNDRRLIQLAQRDNPLVNQLLQAAGRSDITGLVDADRELQLAKAVEDGNAQIVSRLDRLIEQGGLGGSIGQLVVQTPDPIADTSRIVRDIAAQRASGVNP